MNILQEECVEILSSAIHGGVIRTLVRFSVEVSDLSAVSKVVTDVVESVRLDTGAERSHLLGDLFSGVPDHTLDETLATSTGEKVDLGGRGLELHGCLSITL